MIKNDNSLDYSSNAAAVDANDQKRRRFVKYILPVLIFYFQNNQVFIKMQ